MSDYPSILKLAGNYINGQRLHIVWEGPQFACHSLALVNRELCRRLIQNGHELSLEPHEPDGFVPEQNFPLAEIQKCVNIPLSQPADVVIRHQWPPDFTPPLGGHWVMIQPWEFGSIPVSWVEPINSVVDEVWAYTSYVRDCYVRSGVNPDKVHIVPLGVNTDIYRPVTPNIPLPTDKKYRFLFVGGTIYRKGIDLLLAAYRQAFTAQDDVCLVIKDMGAKSFYQGQTAQDMIQQFSNDPLAPEILYIDSSLTSGEMAVLYCSCNCLVHPYRGEGFGLPIAEAMASGLPVIVTGLGAALDFCPPGIAWLIPADEMRFGECRVGNLETVGLPWLAEPNLNAMSDLMRYAFDHPDEARLRGQAACQHIRGQFTWDHSARCIEARLQELCTRPIARFTKAKMVLRVADNTDSPTDDEAKRRNLAKRVEPKTGVLTDMTTIQPSQKNSHLGDVLTIISDAAQRYPDSRNLARHHAELLAQCGRGREALKACETFLVKFGVDNEMLSLALQVRLQIGYHDSLAETGKHSISLCMIVKNEEKNLAACLASLKPVVDEIIVVDTGSSDRTADIATVFGAKVSTFDWNGNFSAARNYAINEAKGKWILVMDADEILSALDYEAVRHAVRDASGKNTAWSVLTHNYTTKVSAQGWTPNDGVYPDEERADGWHPSLKVRLFPHDRRICFAGKVHEMVEHSLRQAGFKIKPARFVVHHYGGLSDVKNREKMLKYFELGKKKLEERPDDIIALHELASQAGELEFYEEALSIWKRVLAINAASKEAFFNMSYVYICLKRYQDGLLAARQTMEIDPGHREAAFNFGTCALYTGNPQEAIELLAPLLSRHPGYPPLLAILTALYLATDNANAARPIYRKLEDMNYSIADYIHDRAATLDSLGRTEMAQQLRAGSSILGIR